MKQLFTAVMFCIVGLSPALMAQRFVHPGIPFTQGDLDLLKANITKAPWAGAYNSFKNSWKSNLGYGMQGPFVEVGRSPDINRTQWQSDMIAIQQLTFMYVFTSDSAYARKATNMLDAWAVTNTVWSGGESMLDLGDYARYYITAADILRGTFPGWTAANTAHVKNYFEKVIWPTSWVPYPLRDHNKGAIQLEIALGVAAFLDDKTKWDQAIEVYRMDAGGGLRNSLPEGEVADAGRDDHWHAQLDALCWGAEVAWKQGVDVFAELDNRLLAAGELYNHYAIDPTGLTYIPFGGYSVYYTNWGIPTGARHQAPYNNIVQAAYSLRKKIATPWTDQMRVLVGEGISSFLFCKSADTSTATALTPIVYPSVETVPTLTNVDIGAVNIRGSAVNNNGIWTVKGAGKSVPDIVNYSFKQVKGNAGMVMKIESNSLTSANTGLMIRASLAPGTNYVSAELHGGGGMNAGSRGDVGRTAGSHYQPVAPWWMKIERVGNRVFTYHSQDGIHWSNNALYITTFPDSVYIGLYTISNNTSALNTAIISHVSVTNTSPAGSPVINSPTWVYARVDTAFQYAITATGSPTTYSSTSLPAGLTLNAATGVISGTPTAMGITNVTLSATNAKGTGSAVAVIYVTSATAPPIPARLVATASGDLVKLTWNSSANATSYTVKRSLSPDGPFVAIQTDLTGRTFFDLDPVPGVANYYIVTAVAGNLESGNSNVVSLTPPPGTPTALVATNKALEIDLTWPAVASVDSYYVKRADTTGGAYTIIAKVGANSYADLNVVSGRPYYYIVSAVKYPQEGSNSPEAFGVPGGHAATWSPVPTDTTWNLGTDWSEGGVPVSPAILTFNASTDTVLNNDITGLEVSRLLFDTDAGKYTNGGNSIVLKNALVNNSANEQTFTLPIVLGGDVNVGANTQNIVLADSVSGTGSLYKTGWGILSMHGNNTYSGNTTIGGASGGWPPTNGIAVAGNGTGTSGAPTAGPLGTGKIIMYGGSLSSYGDATLYNDIEMTASKWSYFYQTGGALILKGRLTGSGTIVEDCNTYAGLHLQGDNSGYTGDFRTQNRSGYHRVFFENPDCGSARASWFLQANNAYGHILNFQSGTLHFGSLAGGGYIRSYQGKPVISIGALNWSSTYSGTMRDFITIEKVGTGTLIFSGNNVYTGTTTILDGTFLLNNNPTLGSFTSPVIAVGGAFGGTGRSTASVTINAGATLEPGNVGVGTLTTDTLTMNTDAIYKVEIDTLGVSSDKMIIPGVVLNNAVLDITVTKATALQKGSAFTIIDNTGTGAVQGTFRGLPESGSILAGGINFRITYKGGTGNDIVLTVGDTTGKLVQTISFTTADTLQTGDADLVLNAVASSGLPVSFASSNDEIAMIIDGYVHVIRSGTIVITASQAGDDLYNPAMVKDTVTIVTGNDNPRAQISIFPNPATEKLTVKLGEVAPEAVMYVYNNQGALVYTSRLTDTVSTVDVQHWAPGLYYIKINNGNIYTEKVIKQ